MNKVLILWLLPVLFLCIQTAAQTKQQLVQSINASIENKREVFGFMEKTGSLEQNHEGILYRFRLDEIKSLEEKLVANNYIVTINCRSGACFSVYRGDSNNSSVNNNAYFFMDPKRSQQFATSMHKLCKMYQPEEEINLVLLNPVSTTSNESTIKITRESDKDGLDSYLEEEAKEQDKLAKKEKIKTQSSPKNKNEENEEDKENETEIKEIKEKTKPISKNNKRARHKEDRATDEDEEVERNTTKRTDRKAKEDTESGVGGLVKDSDDEDKADSKKNLVLTRQLQQILQSASSSQFKSIEGAETNTKTKINESKVKLKGAKRSYLSWHKKQRVFIAEMKTSKDFELLQIEYDELQTEIENSLGPDWEFSDKSNDEEYADFNGEVRDTEYHNAVNHQPTVRIILLSDNDKYTLFVRIK